jgi:hypothetical protein
MAERPWVGCARGIDTRQGSEPRQKVAIEVVHSRCRILRERRIDGKRRHLARAEARIDPQQVDDAAAEQSGRDEQHQGQRHLRHDEDSPEPGLAGTGGDCTRMVLESSGHAWARQLQRRCEAEQQPGGERQSGVEQQQGRVEAGGDRARHVRAHHRQQAVNRPSGDHQPDETAGHGERHALDQELPDERAAAGTERQSDGDLLLPAGGTCDGETCDVRARNEEHEPDHGHQRDQRALELALQLVDALGGGEQFETEPHQHLPEPAVPRPLQLDQQFVDQADKQDSRLCRRPRRRDSRLEPGDHRQPGGAAVVEGKPGRGDLALHRDGHEQVGRIAGNQPAEGRRRDAHDDHRMTVHEQSPPDDGRAGSEPPGPVPVREHHDRIRARLGIVCWCDRPPQRRRDAEHLEQVPGDEFRARSLAGAAFRHADRCGRPGYDTGKSV